MSKGESLEPPRRTASDAAHALTKAGLGSMPIVGAAAAELFQWVIGPPIERRRNEWMNQVGERIRELESERGVRLEDLQNDDAFIDTAMQASLIAIRSSQEEKRRALRNAIVNSALPSAPDEAERHMFLNLVDTFTVWHLRLLDLFSDPVDWFIRHENDHTRLYSGGLADILEVAYPELNGRRDFYDQVWRELYANGLTNTDSLHSMMGGGGLVERRLTERGLSFLRFVSEPEPPESASPGESQ